MANDDRRAKVEAVADFLHSEWWPDDEHGHNSRVCDCMSQAAKIMAVLDRVRDARGDDERRAEIEAARKGLQTILDMPCPFGREGASLAAAQLVASETITELNRLDRVRDARGDDEVAAPMMIAAWVREQAEDKDYGTACEWRNVADAIEREAKDRGWRCECGDLNRDHEAFCYRCGAGPHGDHD
jgi:hypothetical protein